MNIRIQLFIITGLALIIGAFSLKNNNQDTDTLTKASVLESLNKVNNKWQAENDVLEQRAFWHPATYHIGNLAAYQLTKNKKHLNYTIEWAKNNQWAGAKSTNPDEWKFSYGESDEYVLLETGRHASRFTLTCII